VIVFPIFIIFHYFFWKLQNPNTHGYLTFLRQKIAEGHNLTWYSYLWWSFWVMVFNFSSTYIWYISLDKIAVAINFALSNSEVIVVFLLSVWLLKERISFPKVGILLVLIGGLILVGIGKSASSYSGSRVEGIILVMAATLLWGFYEVIYKKYFGKNTSELNSHSYVR
jgi:drug/metabolite transporter (DMT)-like permease